MMSGSRARRGGGRGKKRGRFVALGPGRLPAGEPTSPHGSVLPEVGRPWTANFPRKGLGPAGCPHPFHKGMGRDGIRTGGAVARSGGRTLGGRTWASGRRDAGGRLGRSGSTAGGPARWCAGYPAQVARGRSWMCCSIQARTKIVVVQNILSSVRAASWKSENRVLALGASFQVGSPGLGTQTPR